MPLKIKIQGSPGRKSEASKLDRCQMDIVRNKMNMQESGRSPFIFAAHPPLFIIVSNAGLLAWSRCACVYNYKSNPTSFLTFNDSAAIGCQTIPAAVSSVTPTFRLKVMPASLALFDPLATL
jgi:hypothetical protein